MIKEKYQTYLPSKKFLSIISVIIPLGILVFIIFFMSSKGQLFGNIGEKDKNALKVQNQSITELIQSDTDGDSILDWEEALWGTDKNKKMTFDVPDATYVQNKKKEMGVETSVNEKKLTETEKFAQQFFSSYMALKSSGQIDNETIANFSSVLGQKISDPTLINRYKIEEIVKNSENDSVSKSIYYQKMKESFDTYKSAGLGTELSIVAGGLSSSNENQYQKLTLIGQAYQNFAKAIMKLPVPSDLTQNHLEIANSANNTGISVLNMNKVISDPVIGLSGLSQYQKYSQELVDSVNKLEEILSKE